MGWLRPIRVYIFVYKYKLMTFEKNFNALICCDDSNEVAKA